MSQPQTPLSKSGASNLPPKPANSAPPAMPVANPAMPTGTFVPPKHVHASGKKIDPEQAAQHMRVLTPVIEKQIRAVAAILNVTPSDAEVNTLVGKMSAKLRKNKSLLSFKPDGKALDFSGKIRKQLPQLQPYQITSAQWWGAIIKRPQLLQTNPVTLRLKMAQMVPVLSDANVGRVTAQELRLHHDAGVNRILRDPYLLNVSPETLALSQLYAATYFSRRQPEHRVVVKFGKIRDAWRKKAGLDKGQVPASDLVQQIRSKQKQGDTLTPQETALLVVSDFKQRRRSA